jgi:hypothetical protein
MSITELQLYWICGGDTAYNTHKTKLARHSTSYHFVTAPKKETLLAATEV